MSNKCIQAIDKKSVHQICSGQVVLDLATAVKELIENSLDAGADSIEIKLFEHGRKLIEVSDNGSGINENDFDSIALKHCTSKLSNFADLMFVDTFGFRGEALSSLSAVSDLCLVTKDGSSAVGTKLEFDHDGKVKQKMKIAKEQGTTVSVKNLFYTLPVRLKDLEKNFKKEFGKLVNVLYAYAMVNKHCRFKCTNFIKKNRYVVMATNCNGNLKELITDLFGVTQSKNLIQISKVKEITESCLTEYNLPKQSAEFAKMFTISGCISDVTHGHGRSCPDRQYFFINKRPCDFPKLSRVVNEVYHNFNRNQYPFVSMDISLDKEFVDVNVTPDKRKIMIHRENLLFAIVKATLKSNFEKSSTLYTDNTHNNSSLNSSHTHGQDNSESSPKLKGLLSARSFIENCQSPTAEKIHTGQLKRPLKQDSKSIERKSKIAKLTSWFKTRDSNSDSDEKDIPGEMSNNLSVKISLKDKSDVCENEASCSTSHCEKQVSLTDEEISSKETFRTKHSKYVQSLDDKQMDCDSKVSSMPSDPSLSFEQSSKTTLRSNSSLSFEQSRKTTPQKSPTLSTPQDNPSEFFEQSSKTTPQDNPSLSFEQSSKTTSPLMFEKSSKQMTSSRQRISTCFDFDEIRCHFESKNQPCDKAIKTGMEHGSFYAKISPSDNKVAENELAKHVSKESFLDMKIIGQFNLGFILVKYHSDIFIVDQHATDEKYNFEKLQREHNLKGQKLIRSIALELNCVDEDVLIKNIHIFRKNGFDFDISQNVEGTDSKKKISLTTVPSNRHHIFGVDDVEELLFMLADSPGVICRPSRVRALFASQACRKSVMIGTSLNKQTMRNLVAHMSTIDHPWNCPHGRPTMRHLVNILRVKNPT